MQRDEKDLLKVKDAAARLGVGRTLLYKLMDQGRLTYVKLGRSRRIRPKDLQDLIVRSRVGESDVA
jgi:excisionase family DNA binding protein